MNTPFNYEINQLTLAHRPESAAHTAFYPPNLCISIDDDSRDANISIVPNST